MHTTTSLNTLKRINLLYVPVALALFVAIVKMGAPAWVHLAAMAITWLGIVVISKNVGKEGFAAAISLPLVYLAISGVKYLLVAVGVTILHSPDFTNPTLFLVLLIFMPVITNYRELRKRESVVPVADISQ